MNVAQQTRVLFFALCAVVSCHAKLVDLVVFSDDRPLQLYALLESVETHMKSVGQITVIYHARDLGYKGAYGMVAQEFPRAKFLEQGEKSEEDFKPLTLRATFDSSAAYVLFAVDDNVVKDDVDLSMCIEALERTGAYGFYLRLGDHLNFCYSMNKAQAVPELVNVQDDIFSWQFSHSEFDWAYPHTVNMTVYRKKDIEDTLLNLAYYSLNSLEAYWAEQASNIINRQGLCFKNSKVVNLLLNNVQNEAHNEEREINSRLLFIKFIQGYKLALHPLFQIKNLSAYMEYEPIFILRSVAEYLKGQSPMPEQIILNKEAVKPCSIKKDAAWYKKIAQLDEKPIMIVTASYKNAEWYKKNLDSVFDQNYTNWHLIYVDDCSPDGTGELVKAYVKERGFEDKVTVICNKIRRKAMANLYTAIYMCAPEDIVVILDGDDWLAFPNVLKEVNFMYSTYDVWLTYGQFKEYPSGKIGFCKPYPANIVQDNDFRTYAMGPSHLRTFYAGLFHKIDLLDLLMDGEFVPMTYDLAMMLPMMEMVGEHHMCCDTPLLEYNTSNPINDHKVSQELQKKCDKIIRSKPRYDRVESPF